MILYHFSFVISNILFFHSPTSLFLMPAKQFESCLRNILFSVSTLGIFCDTLETWSCLLMQLVKFIIKFLSYEKVQDLSSLKCRLIYRGYGSLFTCCNCLKKILLQKKKKKKKYYYYKKKRTIFFISWFRDKNVLMTWKKWPMSTFSRQFSSDKMFFLILLANCLQMTLSFLSPASGHMTAKYGFCCMVSRDLVDSSRSVFAIGNRTLLRWVNSYKHLWL